MMDTAKKLWARWQTLENQLEEIIKDPNYQASNNMGKHLNNESIAIEKQMEEIDTLLLDLIITYKLDTRKLFTEGHVRRVIR